MNKLKKVKSLPVGLALWLLAAAFPAIGHAQARTEAAPHGRSQFSQMLNNIEFHKLALDASEQAFFMSGLKEYVQFFPATFTNLKTGEVVQGLKIITVYKTSTKGRNKRITQTGFMDVSEIEELVAFFEKHVNPNIEAELPYRNEEIYEFRSAEIVIRFSLERGDAGRTQATLAVPMTERPYENEYFWTRSQVKNTASVVKTLKYVLAKAKTK